MPGRTARHRVRSSCRLLAGLLTALGPAARSASPQGAHPPTPPTAKVDLAAAVADTAPLIVRGRLVMVFRSPLGALTAVERAGAAGRRLEPLAAAEQAESVTARPIPEGMLVSVGPHGVFTITPTDADTLRGETVKALTAATVARLGTALDAAREARSIPQLLQGAALAVIATLLFLAAVRLLYAGRRFALARLHPAEGRFRALTVGGFTLISPERVLVVLRRLTELIAWALGLFLAYMWLAFVLTRFAYTRPWGEALGTYLTATVGRLALGAISAIPGLFTVVLIFVATRWLSRVVNSFFDSVEGGSVAVPWVHPETANPTKRIVVALLWLFAVVLSYPFLPGSGSDVFKGVSVFAGLVISLGSSGIVNQAMSGLVLMYARALRPGDYVRLGETEGVVTALGMLSTKIRTTKRENVTLPNAVVVAASVKNYSRSAGDAGLLLHTSVTIGYDTPWRQVDALLRRAADRTDGLRELPEPFVLKTALSDYYVEYQLNAVIEKPEERVRVLDRLHGQILDCFNEFGVQIMSPHYLGDPATLKVVGRDAWRPPPAVPEGDAAGGSAAGGAD